jgi:hypothetical protein
MKIRSTAFARATITASLALSLLSLSACKRAVCEPAELEGFWKDNEELVPPGATICSSKASSGDQELIVDFAEDPNPFVTVTKHLESKGFQRTGQSIDNPDIQSMMLERGTPGSDLMILGVNLHRQDGRWNVIFHTSGKK